MGKYAREKWGGVWIGHIGVTFAKSAFIDDYFMDI
jgi:hypothetical protein